MHLGVGQQLQHGIHHTQAGPQDGNQRHAFGQLFTLPILVFVSVHSGRNGNVDRLCRQAVCGFVSQMVGHFLQDRAEGAARRRRASQRRDLVRYDWVRRHMDILA